MLAFNQIHEQCMTSMIQKLISRCQIKLWTWWMIYIYWYERTHFVPWASLVMLGPESWFRHIQSINVYIITAFLYIHGAFRSLNPTQLLQFTLYTEIYSLYLNKKIKKKWKEQINILHGGDVTMSDWGLKWCKELKLLHANKLTSKKGPLIFFTIKWNYEKCEILFGFWFINHFNYFVVGCIAAVVQL